MSTLRKAALAIGVALLGSMAHVTIAATGGYFQPHAVLTLTIAAGVGVGALAIGSAWSNRRRGLAAWLLVAILAGEGFGFVSTAERLIVAREAAQAPLRGAGDAQQKAARRISAAEAALTALTMTTRLDRALTAKAAADQAAQEKAAERGCRDNCRQLLQAQVDRAGEEVAAARAELAQLVGASRSELAVARAAAAELKPPASATPLADRLGAPPWLLDLLASALGSVAANGLAAGLLCFAAHGRKADEPPAAREAVATESTVADVPGHERHFALECLHKGDDGENIMEIRRAYLAWCAERCIKPMSGVDLANALGEIFKHVGIPLEMRDGSIWAVGIRIEHQALRTVPMITVQSRRGQRSGRMARLARA